jgi:hypothetical protein
MAHKKSTPTLLMAMLSTNNQQVHVPQKLCSNQLARTLRLKLVWAGFP